ncbi:uncharacterized protein LOC113492518 isoform X2 [Trichoplusia ni]|uniref:Uncharacterized protein LOC113492518 isoform X2 n=1 Tax=Trichoplusia ni TaxID=7111 RepID=A0A7E5VBZ9_TRINI|nr:uncharacterized protein LOC113492518 isoform X2 [Trichoplusia ni]
MKSETTWRKNSDWKARYSQLYSSRRVFQLVPTIVPKQSSQVEEPRRISFMSNDATPYTSLLMRMRANRRDSSIYGSDVNSPADLSTLLSQRSEFYDSNVNVRSGSSDLGGNETLLLDMVRAKSRELEEAQDKTLKLPRDDVSDDPSSEACVHGLSMRMTERSISRSRVSRVSTRRDMDIPSILAFQTTAAPAPTVLEIPGLKKVNQQQNEDVPRWSIRRSICPVCSQKWKDKTSINNVKYSGLKRNSSAELPSVIAPARLRASITAAYVPRPVLAAVDESKGIGRVMRNTGAAWQLTRARRFRSPKPQVPPPEATAPPSSTAPMARKDLDIRVNRFLRDEGMTKYLGT